MKFCQGPDCHMHKTKDRIKGTKGSKTYQTRRRPNFYYGNHNFCDQRCLYDWINKYIEQGLDHFGRTTEVKHLTEQNAWTKTYDWNSNHDRFYVYLFKSGWCNMNKRDEEIQDQIIKGMYKIFDKLEKRIATLEKVLASHAKCIGEMREDKKDDA